jgi:hypothetical protein
MKAARMAASLGGSVAMWAACGFKLAEADTWAARLKTCRACEFWDGQGFGRTGRCRKCGCSTAAKLAMATSKCPVGKW